MTQNDRNYVSAWIDYRRDGDKIIVLERDKEGALYRKVYNPPYYFYVPDETGEYESIFGDKLSKAEFDSKESWKYALSQFDVKFESDIQPIKRVLMDNYYGRPTPIVNYAFLDIEVDYSQKIGFAGPTNPYAAINAICIYQSWTGQYLSYVLAPPNWTDNETVLYTEINRLIENKQLRQGISPSITICRDERELLIRTCSALEEADILSGWNSEFYDLPYICERLLYNGDEHMLSKLDHLGAKLPKKEMVNRFGTEEPIYKLNGKSHLDYMALFKKFTFEGRTSYSLGNILETEVGIGKLQYSGTLEELYNNDFPLFVAYNFRDTDGLVQLDQKFRFIALVNQMAHENTVHFDAMLGTVSYVETGITNHAHNVLHKIVNDKHIVETEKVEGAIVMTPRIGLHEWIGSVDINSLYPNVCRSLNISPEMIIGQFPAKEEAWFDIWHESSNKHTCIFEGGAQEIASAKEWKQILIDKKYAISAYGTIFDQSKGVGVVADILGFWFAERKKLQAEKKKWTARIKNNELFDDSGKSITLEQAKRYEEQADLLQLTKKIAMNSLYGALLNASFRFGREELGASTTATGRQITKFMIESIGTFLTGEFKPLIKTSSTDKDGRLVHEYHSESDAIIYGDTDSCYYKTYGTTKEEAVEIADLAANTVNGTFPEFMRTAFNCQNGFDTLIKAGREIVAVRGLFQAKKKYMAKIVDLEGFPVDKMKTQGSEIKKADTPKIIQQFLKKTVDMILDGKPYDEVATYINLQRKDILKKKLNIFSLGVAKQVNNLDKFQAEYNSPGTVHRENGNKLGLPGHVRAACNYNFLLEIFDKGSKSIRSGDKAIFFYLKPNTYGFDSIALPSELTQFPKWFDENFKVDIKRTEDKMFDAKLRGIFEALNKDVPSPQSVLINSIISY